VARQVVLVCGPPCGGKSWLVDQHAQPEDLILCVDTFAVEAGSDVPHNHSGRFYRAGEDRFWTELEQVRRTRAVRAWVIRCAPTLTDRRQLAVASRATRTLVLTPPIRVVYRRAIARDHPPEPTLRAIDSWYRRHT
jgi:5-methylcytosine-specific restriction protein A